MNYTSFKQALQTIDTLTFIQADGLPVPSHFHITEVGLVTKHFIDCGGKERTDKVISFQLWTDEDVQHRLSPEKALGIFKQAAFITGEADFELEVEYQTESTVGKFAVQFENNQFYLVNKHTTCLASSVCGVDSAKYKSNLAAQPIAEKSSCCTPGSGCC